MTTATATQTREMVRAYHEAWTGEDVTSAGDYIAEEFITRAPVGSYDSRAEYLAGLANFRQLSPPGSTSSVNCTATARPRCSTTCTPTRQRARSEPPNTSR